MPFDFKVFISYRRDDTIASSGRLYDVLCKKLGKDKVFKDVYNIDGGDEWQKVIDDYIVKSDIFLLLIGKNFLIEDNEGSPRIFSKTDPVRVEVSQALKSKSTKVIPVLVDQKSFPDVTNWPDELKKLSELNAAYVENGREWESTSSELTKTIQKVYLKSIENKSKRRLAPLWRYRYLVLTAIALVTLSVIAFFEYESVKKVEKDGDYRTIKEYINNSRLLFFSGILKNRLSVDSVRITGDWIDESSEELLTLHLNGEITSDSDWSSWRIQSDSLILQSKKGYSSSYSFKLYTDTLILDENTFIRDPRP